MSQALPLHQLAHCRAGDKGEDSLLTVIPYMSDDFERLQRALTPPAIADHFAVPAAGSVTVTPLPLIGAFVVAIRGILDGGVTRATGADPHGKTLSAHMLDFSLADS